MSGLNQNVIRYKFDELHVELPLTGARMLARPLRREGHTVGRRRVRRRM